MSDYTPSNAAFPGEETPLTLPSEPVRFLGLDIHKEYLVATAVNADLEVVYGPRRVENTHVEAWIARTLTPFDAVVLEMTTNTYQVYDALVDKAFSVLVVHPPHIALITRAQVKTDRKAARPMPPDASPKPGGRICAEPSCKPRAMLAPGIPIKISCS